MSEIITNISIPLDTENYLRRECPLCCEEFKIQMSKDELIDLANAGIESFLTDEEANSEDEENEEVYFYCPYCGQQASSDHFWTQEQLSYLQIYAENIAAKLINENLIKPMKRNLNKSSGGFISIKFEGKEIEYDEPWISEEVDDMVEFDLPCCNTKIKIKEEWKKEHFCFYCGFKH